MRKISPLREPELVQMLAHEPELLAIADALVETQHERRPQTAKARRWKPLLLAAVVTAALAGASVAIAAGFGAFNGLSDAQHPQIGTAVLDPATLAGINAINTEHAKLHIPEQLLPDTARVLGKMPDGSPIYGLTDNHGALCIVGGIGGSCDLPLSKTHPVITMESNATGNDPVAYGVVMEGITTVTFQAGPQEVTVPVKDNIWYYAGPNSAAERMTIHFADGSSETLNEDCTMPLQQARATACGGNS